MSLTAPIIWIIIAIIFAIIEGVTLGLTTIWFTIGAVVAGIIAKAGGSLTIQLIGFLVTSFVLLVFTRPITQKKLNLAHTKDVTEALLDQTALVVSDIVPFSMGQVKVNGQIWSAKAEDGDMTIKEGIEVKIMRIEGVKLIVSPIQPQPKNNLSKENEQGGIN